MKDYLLIEKSKFKVESKNPEDKYTLEGVFTEFDNENRNGRVYTKKEFQPHFEALKKVIESGTCVGELDHPKQFETTLKNVAHKIEEIWMDEDNNRVMGRIKLLDTDAGKQAKALIDGGIPLHISSRAAGTVSENKEVKIHKLFTYDLVDTPGFANARLGGVNESFGMINESAELDTFSDFAVFEVEKQIRQDMDELNNKNKDTKTMEYIKESEFNKYTDFTKEAIEEVKSEILEMKGIQDSIIVQNDSIVDEYSNADFKKRLDAVDEKLASLEELTKVEEKEEKVDEALHVGGKYKDGVITSIEVLDDGSTKVFVDANDEPYIIGKTTIEAKTGDDTLQENEIPLAKADALQVGGKYKGGTITALEVQEDGSTKVFVDANDEPFVIAKTKVDDILDDKTMQENLSKMEEKYAELEAKFEAMVKWSNHTTETVSAIEKWSDHTSEAVTKVEESTESLTKWSDHVTESVSLLETKSVDTKVEDAKVEDKKINESKVDDFKKSIYNKLESILEGAKEQEATDNKSLNESKSEKVEEKTEAPLWMQMIPSKYKETWKGLEESEQVRITKRANLFEFKTNSSIKDFWNNEFTKENLIKEEKVVISKEQAVVALNEKRANAVAGYRRLFQ